MEDINAARKVLNEFRNRNYNSINREEREAAIALDIVLPYLKMLERDSKRLVELIRIEEVRSFVNKTIERKYLEERLGSIKILEDK